MSIGDGPFEDLKVPLTWTATAAALVAALIAIGLLLGDRREGLGAQGYGPVRALFDSAVTPVATGASTPVRLTGDLFADVGGYFDAAEENRRLRAEVAELRRWRDAAVALRDRNARLSDLLRLRVEPDMPMVAAHAVTDSRGPFANARLIDAGEELGVRVGHPVMSSAGLLGRIAGVARGVARVLLLTDTASRTPVLVDRTDARAILTGDGGPAPRLDYLRGQSPVRAGDRLLTSGDGGVFPRGLPVGVAVRGADGAWRARLFSDRTPIDYVRVLLFDDYSALAEQPAINTPRLPPPPPVPTPSAQPPSEGAAPAATAPTAARPVR